MNSHKEVPKASEPQRPSEASWMAVSDVEAREISFVYTMARKASSDKEAFDALVGDSRVLLNIGYLFPVAMITFPDLPWPREKIAILESKHNKGQPSGLEEALDAIRVAQEHGVLETEESKA